MNIKSEIEINVRYSDVDLMGVVYNVKYYEYFELGRLDFIDKFIMPYQDLVQKECIQIPVTQNSSKYYKPAYYADVLQLVTILEKLTNKRLLFSYKLFKSDKLIAEGASEHAFIKNGIMKSCEVPRLFIEKLSKLVELEWLHS